MKKRLISIFLSATLFSQVGISPQVFAKQHIDNISNSVVQDKESKIVRILKYVGVPLATATLVGAGLYCIYDHFRQDPKITEPSTPDVFDETSPINNNSGLNQGYELPAVQQHNIDPAPPIDDIPLASNVHPDSTPELEQKIRDFEIFLNRCLQNDYLLPADEICQICGEAKDVLIRESSLLRINGSTIVVGDTHANIGSLEYSIRKFLKEVRDGKSILFLGDYVDRGQFAPGGPNSIKNVALLFKLKTMFPDKVFLLRGNHEITSTSLFYGFFEECREKYDGVVYYNIPEVPTEDNPDPRVTDFVNFAQDDNASGVKIYRKVHNIFCYLPLVGVVNNNTFCVHGGISPELQDLHQISNIEKPLSSYNINQNRLAMDLLWSDPENRRGFCPNGRGAGKKYGHDVVREFLARHNLRCILRAHQTVNGHRDVFGDGSVITLFSAPDYGGPDSNIGEIAEINGDTITYERIRY